MATLGVLGSGVFKSVILGLFNGDADPDMDNLGLSMGGGVYGGGVVGRG